MSRQNNDINQKQTTQYGECCFLPKYPFMLCYCAVIVHVNFNKKETINSIAVAVAVVVKGMVWL